MYKALSHRRSWKDMMGKHIETKSRLRLKIKCLDCES